ncbi:Glutarate-semialdehyde dehydrogenase [Paraburkholderia aspalathi]|uniref:NAD-dependent succinate-semialdehyde dehydrogenase n=1 Tax=Paraburkholderia aspalathi TaxID=1324617 RepID=UPI00190D24FC|nr:NAD-dependent succinate-semialdehyde dehydrogenase [Paraburkholderia aspalathi]MBK3842287.1 NAD-dependent succinate-semialdehyde dehydrogenase [Paraburkholderia aspalathi]CAE6827559.1 Glutarate-semialdehyde dehydrogenase [Paraburkholderia aspalathi]CAE6832886.1 Glutarate-semialdehyde dehydrogenase [Paraburkholderia aspalathi]
MHLKDPTLLKQQCLIGGQWCNADDGRMLTVTNPADGSVIGTVPRMGATETRRAIDAAHAAFPGWRRRTARDRSALLRKWYDLVLENVDDLALLLTTEQGKPVAEAKGEIVANAAYLEWFAEEAKRIYGDVIPQANGQSRVVVLKQPIGVCGAITPWNFPNGMITRKAGPALAAGCVMVLKPASKTPLSALALAELALRAGLPAGVFSVVTGDAMPIGTELCHNEKVAKITFTGSTEVGRFLLREGADTIKKMSMELGGNAPFIVFDDADVDRSVEGAMIAKYRNSGQTCVCANRIYVHDSLYDVFAAKLVEKVKDLRVGAGTDAGVSLGPLIDLQAVAKVEEHIADALAQGATVAYGGNRHALGGSFFEPTVMTGVTQTMKVCREETFAPLAALIRFHTEAEVIEMANQTEFGLAAYFYARDLGRVWRVAEAIETGIVGVNSGLIANEMAPFGGVKQSGLGREGSKYGIDDYLEIKYVCLGGIESV